MLCNGAAERSGYTKTWRLQLSAVKAGHTSVLWRGATVGILFLIIYYGTSLQTVDVLHSMY